MGPVVGPGFSILVVYYYIKPCLGILRPPINGLDDPWHVSRRCLEPRWFVGDPTSLACDNIYPHQFNQ